MHGRKWTALDEVILPRPSAAGARCDAVEGDVPERLRGLQQAHPGGLAALGRLDVRPDREVHGPVGGTSFDGCFRVDLPFDEA